MKKVLYLDCFSGISGDMTIGALIDIGLDFKHLLKEIKKLGLSGYKLKNREAMAGGMMTVEF